MNQDISGCPFEIFEISFLYLRSNKGQNIHLINPPMDNCTLNCIEIIGNFSSQGTCAFVQQNCHQDTLQVVQAYYCLTNASFFCLLIATIVVLLFTYYALNIATDDYLAPCLEDFIVKLNMSEALAGITFLALANGAPDILTAVVAGTSSSGSTVLIPFGSLYGAALFSMGFILSMVIYYSKGRTLQLNLRQALVPLGFYIVGTLYLVGVSYFYGKMNIACALTFFGFYIVYIAFVVYEEWKKNKIKEKPNSMLTGTDEDLREAPVAKRSFGEQMDEVYQQIHQQQDLEDQNQKQSPLGKIRHYVRAGWMLVFDYTIPVILKDRVEKRKLGVSLVLSGVVLWVARGVPQVFEEGMGGLAYAVWFSVPSAILLLYLVVTAILGKDLYFTTIYNIYAFVVIVCWISLVVGILLNLMELLQMLTNVNSVFLGLTVFAWANSIGDYLSIVTFAKKGYSSTAVAGIFSGQLLNFLIGFGIALILNSLSSGEYDFNIFAIEGGIYEKLSDSIVIVVIGLSFVYMTFLFILLLKNKGLLSMAHSSFQKIFYIVFVLIALFISILTDFFNEPTCDL